MAKFALVETTGAVTPLEGEHFVESVYPYIGDMIEIYSCSAPILRRYPDRLLLVVDEWGYRKQLPVNMTAWALYGGSAIVGDAIICYDSPDDGSPRAALPDDLIELIDRPLVSWMPDYALKRMREIAP